MGNTAWKRHERETARAFGVERNLRGADFSESAGDTTEHSLFVIECKYRKTIPKLVVDSIDQARRYDDKKIPIGVLRERGKHGAYVVIRLSDFVDLLGNLPI